MNRVLCQGCRVFHDRDDMRKVGLGYVCNDKCMELVRQRAREKRARRESNRAKHSRGALDTNRRAVRVRDGRSCRWCGRGSMLQAHHIKYRSEGGGHELSNLITLCMICHERAHSDKRRYQHVLIETVRLTEAGQFLTVPEVETRLLAASGNGES